MIFRICDPGEQIVYRRNIVQLQTTEWEEDGFQTAFDATFFDHLGRKHPLGLVRIGMQGMEQDAIRKFLPKEFRGLPENFFSLGQDETYYEQVKQLWIDTREQLLGSLRDIAYKPEILDANVTEDVLLKSLICGVATEEKVALSKIRGQLHRIANGDAQPTKYNFTYTAPAPKDKTIAPVVLEFNVNPDSNPPTNVHAIIGRNGCGKTYLIRNMVRCLQDNDGTHGTFTYTGSKEETADFVNVLCITFSPFDDFELLLGEDRDLPATFVGLSDRLFREEADNSDKTDRKNRLLDAIGTQFWGHLCNCLITKQRYQLWQEAIKILRPNFDQDGDEIFDAIDELMRKQMDSPGDGIISNGKQQIMQHFIQLSSGHKVVLLTVASCVAEIEERSILFLDEPETHLHPPLLSSLIRALSELLKKRNGVAIVSTHSPVVLQEVPSKCVWVLDRYGSETRVRKLDVPSFGATVGLLTTKVFGLKSRTSGFYQLLKDVAARYDTYEDIVAAFDDELGDQAELMIHTMLMLNKRRDN